MSRLLIRNLSFIAINCIKLRFRIATVQLEELWGEWELRPISLLVLHLTGQNIYLQFLNKLDPLLMRQYFQYLRVGTVDLAGDRDRIAENP